MGSFDNSRICLQFVNRRVNGSNAHGTQIVDWLSGNSPRAVTAEMTAARRAILKRVKSGAGT